MVDDIDLPRQSARCRGQNKKDKKNTENRIKNRIRRLKNKFFWNDKL